MAGKGSKGGLVMMAAVAVAAAVGAGAAAGATRDCMDMDAPSWTTTAAQARLYERLVAYLACPGDDPAGGALADQVACNYFVGKVLSDLHGIDDFSTGAGTWLTANQIHDYVSSETGAWSRLGSASDQRVLDDAAAGAANGQPVIALMRGAPGHVAIVLPGSQKPSASWGGLRVPNSAAFSLGNVDKAYVFCRLSYAFADPQGVDIFWRVKN